MPSSRRRRRGLLLTACSIVAVVVAGAGLSSIEDNAPALVPPREARIDVLDGPTGQEQVQIDATLYAPERTPAPAVLLSHGFGGDKNSTATQAKDLARRGFTVLTYSSRGFGRSSGRIALNTPEHEVADAQQILDWLARQPEVLRDRDGDPRVGVTGDSYGGALSLLLAGSDHRVDAVAPVMTYNNLEQALLPNAASTDPGHGPTPARGMYGEQRGVFKRAWAGLLFSSGAKPQKPTTQPRTLRQAPPTGASSDEVSADTSDQAQPSDVSALCGNFTAEVCAAYTEVAETGQAGPEVHELLASASPYRVTREINAPTLIAQGQRDTLFGLEQADANARQIAESGTKVKVLWYAGGHDGAPPSARVRAEIARWFAFHLGEVGPASDPGTGFFYDIESESGDGIPGTIRTVQARTYPGLHTGKTDRFSVRLDGSDTLVLNPPGGTPAATSWLPGSPATGDATGHLAARRDLAQDWPGQVAVFRSAAFSQPRVISGVPRTRLRIASVPGEPSTDEAVLFAKLYDVSPDGRRSLLGQAVSPLRTALPSSGESVEVSAALPGVVHAVPQGHRIELAVSTTDQAYDVPEQPAVYRVGLAEPATLSLPSVPARSVASADVPAGPLIGIAVVCLFLLFVWLINLIRRRQSEDLDADLTDTPLLIDGVSKSYGDNSVVVNDVSVRTERGQIVGLLGPNGAGKTTTLRMLLGLVRPTAGVIRIFGHRVTPGAAVLSRTGSLVETPGFAPYLSGLDNLRSYWAMTGLPLEDAHFDEVARIAELDSALERRVSTYSHGMRQRLAIAQAMLGLPELLVLDEPTNGLAPTQIRQLREVLRRYADTGRTVLLSSHLLTEVEQTCTHVVVLHAGQVVTSGPVEELVAARSEVTFQVDEPALAAETLRCLEGIGDVRVDQERVHAELGGHAASVAVNALVAAGVAVTEVVPRRQLADTFLRLVGEERA